MARILFASALALGATLAAGGFATAAEPAKSSFGGGFSATTMTLGGQGTATSAATAAEDTELTHGYRGGYYGGYRGYYGGYRGFYGGYRGFYGRGWGYRGWGYPYSYAYRPFFRPWRGYYGYGGYGYGGYGYPGYAYGGFGPGIYIGINGTQDDVNAPVMTLNLAGAKNPFVAEPSRSNDLNDEPGTFPYDGDPANPVPQVRPDAEPRSQGAPAAVGLPVSLKKEIKPANPYRYKAYGEK